MCVGGAVLMGEAVRGGDDELMNVDGRWRWGLDRDRGGMLLSEGCDRWSNLLKNVLTPWPIVCPLFVA